MQAEKLTAEFGIAGIVDFVETEHGRVKAAISRRYGGPALPAGSTADRLAAAGAAAGPFHVPTARLLWRQLPHNSHSRDPGPASNTEKGWRRRYRALSGCQ